MRIMFMGTPEFAVPCLNILLENRYPVAGVVTVPDKAQGRGQKTGISPVKRVALEHSLPLLQPEDLKNPDFLSNVKSLHPDLIVVVAFRILPPEVYSLALSGAFNLHASLLPKYRGAAPINWAIMRGEKETGVTTFFLNETVDTGSMILQARVKIGPDETAGELHDKLAEVGAEIVLQTVRVIELGKAQPRSQDNSLASPAPKIFKEDCRIVWDCPRAAVHDFVRGLSPVPGAWTMFREKVIRVYRTSLKISDVQAGSKPGTVARCDDDLVIRTNDGVISILEIQQEGRRRMPAPEFLRGFEIHEGDQFS
ncbi:MAG: methionyl-tRNA formyltransferase [Bacteroidota bacterium]